MNVYCQYKGISNISPSATKYTNKRKHGKAKAKGENIAAKCRQQRRQQQLKWKRTLRQKDKALLSANRTIGGSCRKAPETHRFLFFLRSFLQHRFMTRTFSGKVAILPPPPPPPPPTNADFATQTDLACVKGQLYAMVSVATNTTVEILRTKRHWAVQTDQLASEWNDETKEDNQPVLASASGEKESKRRHQPPPPLPLLASLPSPYPHQQMFASDPRPLLTVRSGPDLTEVKQSKQVPDLDPEPVTVLEPGPETTIVKRKCRCRRRSDVSGESKRSVTSSSVARSRGSGRNVSHLKMATSAAVVAVAAAFRIIGVEKRGDWVQEAYASSRRTQLDQHAILEKIRSVKSTVTDLQQSLLKLQLEPRARESGQLRKAVEDWRRRYRILQFRQAGWLATAGSGSGSGSTPHCDKPSVYSQVTNWRIRRTVDDDDESDDLPEKRVVAENK